jgi:hypothetical protein
VNTDVYTTIVNASVNHLTDDDDDLTTQCINTLFTAKNVGPLARGSLYIDSTYMNLFFQMVKRIQPWKLVLKKRPINLSRMLSNMLSMKRAH